MTTQHTPEYKTWDRFTQLEFLQDTTSEQFQRTLLDQIVSSMSDEEFQDTYEHITRMHDIARDHEQLEQQAQSPA